MRDNLDNIVNDDNGLVTVYIEEKPFSFAERLNDYKKKKRDTFLFGNVNLAFIEMMMGEEAIFSADDGEVFMFPESGLKIAMTSSGLSGICTIKNTHIFTFKDNSRLVPMFIEHLLFNSTFVPMKFGSHFKEYRKPPNQFGVPKKETRDNDDYIDASWLLTTPVFKSFSANIHLVFPGCNLHPNHTKHLVETIRKIANHGNKDFIDLKAYHLNGDVFYVDRNGYAMDFMFNRIGELPVMFGDEEEDSNIVLKRILGQKVFEHFINTLPSEKMWCSYFHPYLKGVVPMRELYSEFGDIFVSVYNKESDDNAARVLIKNMLDDAYQGRIRIDKKDSIIMVWLLFERFAVAPPTNEMLANIYIEYISDALNKTLCSDMRYLYEVIRGNIGLFREEARQYHFTPHHKIGMIDLLFDNGPYEKDSVILLYKMAMVNIENNPKFINRISEILPEVTLSFLNLRGESRAIRYGTLPKSGDVSSFFYNRTYAYQNPAALAINLKTGIVLDDMPSPTKRKFLCLHETTWFGENMIRRGFTKKQIVTLSKAMGKSNPGISALKILCELYYTGFTLAQAETMNCRIDRMFAFLKPNKDDARSINQFIDDNIERFSEIVDDSKEKPIIIRSWDEYMHLGNNFLEVLRK